MEKRLIKENEKWTRGGQNIDRKRPLTITVEKRWKQEEQKYQVDKKWANINRSGQKEDKIVEILQIVINKKVRIVGRRWTQG